MLQGVFKLKGVVQHYSWGGFDFIPRLLGIENKEHKPFAEYWLGDHPNYSAILENDSVTSLATLLNKDPVTILGEAVAIKFSSLPYLLKLLDVRQMLSIQVHPEKNSAMSGFEEENKKGIPVNAPHRNYKDRNHKPELLVALSDFWLLHGFKKEEVLKEKLASINELRFLNEVFETKGYKALYEKVMLMDQETVNKILDPLLKRIIPLYQNNQLQKSREDFWAARAALDFCKDNNYDRGIFSIYLFNLLQLKKGEGIFQPAGLPHAYLEGQNVEIMANSDNVLRAGLTDKHIDVPELMKHVHFEATLPNILRPQSSKHIVYASPAEEFELHQYQFEVGETETILTETAETWLVTEGSLKIKNEDLQLNKGEALFIIAGTKVDLHSVQPSTMFRVTVPVISKN